MGIGFGKHVSSPCLNCGVFDFAGVSKQAAAKYENAKHKFSLPGQNGAPGGDPLDPRQQMLQNPCVIVSVALMASPFKSNIFFRSMNPQLSLKVRVKNAR